MEESGSRNMVSQDGSSLVETFSRVLTTAAGQGSGGIGTGMSDESQQRLMDHVARDRESQRHHEERMRNTAFLQTLVLNGQQNGDSRRQEEERRRQEEERRHQELLSLHKKTHCLIDEIETQITKKKTDRLIGFCEVV